MKELFIAEANTTKLRVSGAITLAATILLLLVVVGCAPSAKSAIDKSQPWATVQFTIEKTTKYAPTFAIWVTDEASEEAATLAATKKAAKGELANRPGALPVWSAAKSHETGDAADTVSTATPTGSAELTVQLPGRYKGKKITLYIEANASYDYNTYYAEGLKSGDAGYNDVNGQPSVVWAATIDTAANPSGTVTPAVAGHGDVLGSTGTVDGDMANITTAASILQNITISYSMGNK
jgi:hypothetical protein